MTFLLNLMFCRLGKFDGLYSGEWGEGKGIYMGGEPVFRMLIGLHISGRVVYSGGILTAFCSIAVLKTPVILDLHEEHMHLPKYLFFILTLFCFCSRFIQCY